MMSKDTICAIATPNGIGAIGMIRVSGEQSIKIVSSIFSKDLSEAKTHTLHFGIIKDSKGTIIDEVLISVFSKGRSYTDEESCEISYHGSSFIQQSILTRLLESGCRLAEPGEFTQRAFLNGKLDLSQAEAVADLIASQSKRTHEIALKQLRGRFSSELKELREKLINFASLVELELDFGEEDVEFADRSELGNLVEEVINYIERLASSFALGNALKNGVPVAIVGAPNTGKSTLLNQLLGEERAIVSDIAGTTRDVIEELLNIDGIQFRLIDTAGIREGAADIEALGIERTMTKIEQAKIVMCLSDGTKPEEVVEVDRWVKKLQDQHSDKEIFQLVNKIDVAGDIDSEALGISAHTGKNMEQLKSKLVEIVQGDYNFAEDTIITNVRHHEALLNTLVALRKAKEGIDIEVSGDFIAMDIRQAMYHLGSITGDISTDDLLGNIFSNFCIGK